jgi:hypothetical protein
MRRIDPAKQVTCLGQAVRFGDRERRRSPRFTSHLDGTDAAGGGDAEKAEYGFDASSHEVPPYSVTWNLFFFCECKRKIKQMTLRLRSILSFVRKHLFGID